MSKFIPWVGSKSYLSDTIVNIIAKTKHYAYIEPFMGSATIFFSKPHSKNEIINDINGELVNLFKVVQKHPEEFKKQFQYTLISRDMYYILKDTNVNYLTDIERAARFFYLQRVGFGGKVVGASFGYTVSGSPVKLNLDNIDEIVFEVHHRLRKVIIENKPYDDILIRYDKSESLFYLDPPYWGTEKFYGKEYFSKDDFYKLADILKGLKGKFILSINDTEEIRAIFKDYSYSEVDVKYTIGEDNSHQAKELIYTNYIK